MSESTLSSDHKSYIDSNRSVNKAQSTIELGIHRILKNAFQDMAEDTVDMKALLPISILLEEMKSDYSSTRTYCLQNLATIALVLGPARAKGLLGGFISNILKDQDEGVEDVPEEHQVMLTLLESLPKLVNLIGGPEQSMVLLRTLFETISDRSKDETKAMYIRVIKQIASKIYKNHRTLIEEYLIAKIGDLKDGTPQEQQAALLLIANLYPPVSQNALTELLSFYKQLAFSKESQVRKKAVLCLKDAVSVADNENQLALWLDMGLEIYNNGKDFKSNLFYMLPVISKHKDFESLEQYPNFVNQLLSMQNTNSYNVFIEVFIELLTNLKENKRDCRTFIQHYFALMKLQELEVKQKISLVVGRLVIFLKESQMIYRNSYQPFLQQTTSYLREVEKESNFMIKLNLVDQVTQVLNFALEKKAYFYQKDEIQFYIQYLLQQLIAGDTDLKHKFLSKLKSFALILQFVQDQVFAADEAKKIIENLFVIVQAIEACKNWRMRSQCLQSLQLLILNVQQFKLLPYTECYAIMEDVIKKLLQDRIASVREEANKASNCLFTMYKQNDLQKQASVTVAKFSDLTKHQNYLVRVNCILGLRVAIHFGNPVLEIFKKLKQHEVPNVKLAMLEVLLNSKEQYPDLLPLNDIDNDVRDVAKRILEIWRK